MKLYYVMKIDPNTGHNSVLTGQDGRLIFTKLKDAKQYVKLKTEVAKLNYEISKYEQNGTPTQNMYVVLKEC